ncbi:MAG: branched-chain amino acid transport system II carrier protein [Parachlamydia sp.]|jgi:LIVCS family branched-chain amino acid:cation transporter|nr:branched-chain amino acid transport system II carrier protein [Parachlamydia sp.]
MKKSVVISTGFALFSMFFGSGNLVFPIAVGVESGGHYFLASLGVLCTCVFFPLIGMLGMTLYRGDLKEFFGCLGEKGVFFFSFLALALMGPFGVLARCLTVMHGSLQLIFPAASLPATSFALCAVIYSLSVNKTKIVSLLGTYLTPLLLFSVGAIVTSALLYGAPSETTGNFGAAAFKNGFFKGYQTMDLVASFFFSGFVISHLNTHLSDEKEILKTFTWASFIGAALLYAFYFSLVLLGWIYAPLLANTLPQEMLGKIAFASLGPIAAPCICITIIFACLTTAIALASLFSEFLRVDVAKEKMSAPLSLLLTLGIAFFVSTLNFSGIANFLGPILEAIYPALVALSVINIAAKWAGVKTTHWPFTVTLLTKLFWV